MAQAHPMARTREADNASLSEEARRKYFTAAWWLTPYALGCGYKESVRLRRAGGLHNGDEGVTVELWLEHGAYCVRSHDFDAGRRLYSNGFRVIDGHALIAARRAFGNAIWDVKKTFADTGFILEKA